MFLMTAPKTISAKKSRKEVNVLIIVAFFSQFARTSANDTPPAFAPAFKAFLISRLLSPIIVLPHHNLANVLKMFFKMFIQNNP